MTAGAASAGAGLRAVYAARAAAARRDLAAEESASGRLSFVRLALALAAVGLALWASSQRSPNGIGWLAGAAGVGFFVAVAVHDRVERRAVMLQTHVAINEEAIRRIARDWEHLPPPALPPADPHHPFAADLDLFGRASLFELIGAPATVAGRETLRAWLLVPAIPEEIVQRQRAVAELASQLDLRQTIAAQARLVAAVSSFDFAAFLAWAESPPWLHAHPALLWTVRGLTAATPLLLIAQLIDITPNAWWLATVAAGLLLSWIAQRPMARALGRSGAWEPAIRAYRDLAHAIEQTSWEAPVLHDLRSALGEGSHMASRAIARFGRIVAFADLRHAPLLHFPVHALSMWDFHVWAALEHWQQRYGVQVRGWLHAIGEIEAIAALAGLAHDHPDWAFPTVNSRFVAFEARALGHPLLSDGARVPNDVRVGPRGRVLCVTGSNMSGKSTLLRAIGTNAVLAQAGAPVCAASLEMPPLSAHTSLRVNDSLQEGVSYFMASLQRLRIILDVARQQHGAGEGNCEQTGTTTRGSDDRPMLLYLLDEILQGTNSAEREVAVRLVLRRLLQARAVGAITTHDLTLTATPELQAAGDHVHFAEAIDGSGAQGMLTFDYRLRPGVATSRNALRLMELVGLVGHAEVEAIDTGRRLDSSPSDPDS